MTGAVGAAVVGGTVTGAVVVGGTVTGTVVGDETVIGTVAAAASGARGDPVRSTPTVTTSATTSMATTISLGNPMKCPPPVLRMTPKGEMQRATSLVAH